MIVLWLALWCLVGAVVVSPFSFLQPRRGMYRGGGNCGIMTANSESSVLQCNNMQRGGRSLLPSTVPLLLSATAASESSRFSGRLQVLGAAATSQQESQNDDGIFKNIGTKENEIKFSNFNPFDYKALSHSSSTSNSAYSSYSAKTQISLRKTQMQELVSDLLNVVQENNTNNHDDVNAILQEMLTSSKDMLLEPLEDVANAVLDPYDSIYTPNMTRRERYQAYRSSMEERLSTARNPQVRRVLQELKDFVLSFE
jgi:hypothetical protein